MTLPVPTAVGIGTLVALGALALETGQANAQPPPCNEFREGGVDEALRADPGHDKACHARALALIRDGGKYDYRLGEAERIYKTLLRLRPQSPFAYTGLAELQMRKLELGIEVDAPLQQVHDAAERGTRVAPVLPEAFVTLGRAELLIGCLPCAARAAEAARAKGADTPELAALRSRIAELGGDAERARGILQTAIAAPTLTAEDRSWLNGVLAEHHARGGRFEEADRALGDAVAAQPENLSAYVRRAELRLFDLGDVEGALRAAGGNRRATSSVEFKRVRAMALYLEWSRGRIAGRPAGDLQRIVRTSYLGPEDALVICAGHSALAKEFEVMLEAGLVQDVDARDGAGLTALLSAAAGGNARAARLLVARKADVDAADRYGRRALSLAVEKSDHVMMALLLHAGATADFVDRDGRSPLLSAVQRRDHSGAELLLRQRAGGDPALPYRAGDLLASAATQGDVSMLGMLLDAGIPADTPDGQKRTALVAAVSWGHGAAARLLLERGADASLALEAARDTGDGAMLELLRPFLKRST